MPFSEDKPISLMVHRVGKTLLIDDFDVHKHLLRRQRDDWKWLKEFYRQQVLLYFYIWLFSLSLWWVP